MRRWICRIPALSNSLSFRQMRNPGVEFPPIRVLGTIGWIVAGLLIGSLGLEATGDPVFCSLWSLVGFPSLNLPLLANTDGLPIGVQLVGAPGRDEWLLRTARTLVKQLAEAE